MSRQEITNREKRITHVMVLEGTGTEYNEIKKILDEVWSIQDLSYGEYYKVKNTIEKRMKIFF